MACITRIIGTGVASCPGGSSNGISYNLTYPGDWTLGSVPDCGSAVAPFDSSGAIHPFHRFSSVQSITYEGCTQLPSTAPHDCINGNCLPKTIYGTPGVFANLAACQSGCAKNSTCTGECVDPAEIAALGQALNTLQSKFCN